MKLSLFGLHSTFMSCITLLRAAEQNEEVAPEGSIILHQRPNPIKASEAEDRPLYYHLTNFINFHEVIVWVNANSKIGNQSFFNILDSNLWLTDSKIKRKLKKIKDTPVSWIRDLGANSSTEEEQRDSLEPNRRPTTISDEEFIKNKKPKEVENGSSFTNENGNEESSNSVKEVGHFVSLFYEFIRKNNILSQIGKKYPNLNPSIYFFKETLKSSNKVVDKKNINSLPFTLYLNRFIFELDNLQKKLDKYSAEEDGSETKNEEDGSSKKAVIMEGFKEYISSVDLKFESMLSLLVDPKKNSDSELLTLEEFCKVCQENKFSEGIADISKKLKRGSLDDFVIHAKSVLKDKNIKSEEEEEVSTLIADIYLSYDLVQSCVDSLYLLPHYLRETPKRGYIRSFFSSMSGFFFGSAYGPEDLIKLFTKLSMELFMFVRGSKMTYYQDLKNLYICQENLTFWEEYDIQTIYSFKWFGAVAFDNILTEISNGELEKRVEGFIEGVKKCLESKTTEVDLESGALAEALFRRLKLWLKDLKIVNRLFEKRRKEDKNINEENEKKLKDFEAVTSGLCDKLTGLKTNLRQIYSKNSKTGEVEPKSGGSSVEKITETESNKKIYILWILFGVTSLLVISAGIYFINLKVRADR